MELSFVCNTVIKPATFILLGEETHYLLLLLLYTRGKKKQYVIHTENREIKEGVSERIIITSTTH